MSESKKPESEPMEVASSLDENEDVKIEEEFIEQDTFESKEREVETTTEEVTKEDTIVENQPKTIKDTEKNKNISSNTTSDDIPAAAEKVDESKEGKVDEIEEKVNEDDEEENVEKTKEKENEVADGENSNVMDDDDIDDEPIIEEEFLSKPEKKNQGSSNLPVPKDASTFRMHLTTEEIDKMINDGTLEKVSDGHYRVRPESVKNLKSTPLAMAKELNLENKSSDGPEVVKVMNSNPSVNTNAVLANPIVAPLPVTQVTSLPIVQQAPLIALMPVNQVSTNTNNNAFIALPMQQNSTTVAYTTTLPTFVAISQAATSPQTTTVSSSEIPMTSSKIKIGPASSKVVENPVETPSITSIVTSTLDKSCTSDESTKSPLVSDDANPSYTPTSFGVKRKPIFDITQVKRPYKFAKLADKPKKKVGLRHFVGDMNSSDEENEGLAKCKTYGTELASMFFKKVGESKTSNKSLLDKLHKAVFNIPDSESDQESETESDIEETVEKIKTGKADYNVVNCPGPNKYEAFIGPSNNSKLSIVKCQEVRQAKNASYELYKVRVVSAGREANTNILIPIPEGYKLNFPSKPKEETVEFSHTPHEDTESLNNVSPVILEKMAKTEIKLKKYKDQIKVLRTRYIELLEEYSNRPQFSTVSDLVGSAAKFLTEDQLVFFLMQLKAGAHNMQGIRYSVREKILALAIYQKSPEVYKYLSKIFNLPPKRVLDQWLEEVGSQDPKLLKKLMYHIYINYNYKAKD